MFTRDQFRASEHLTAVCGIYLGGDAVHVGIAFKDEGDEWVIHFKSGNDIPLEDLENITFTNYIFNPVGINPSLVPSLSALAELVSENNLEPFTFNRTNVVYEGGKFEQATGAYQHLHAAERVVNCGVFTVGLLKTFDHDLIQWDTWPIANAIQAGPYLEPWFAAQGVPQEERDYYYRSARTIRGKHVIVCPDTPTQPSPYLEAELMGNELIDKLNA